MSKASQLEDQKNEPEMLLPCMYAPIPDVIPRSMQPVTISLRERIVNLHCFDGPATDTTFVSRHRDVSELPSVRESSERYLTTCVADRERTVGRTQPNNSVIHHTVLSVYVTQPRLAKRKR